MKSLVDSIRLQLLLGRIMAEGLSEDYRAVKHFIAISIKEEPPPIRKAEFFLDRTILARGPV